METLGKVFSECEVTPAMLWRGVLCIRRQDAAGVWTTADSGPVSRVDPEVSLMTAVTEENVTKAVLICSQEMAIRAQALEPADNIERDQP